MSGADGLVTNQLRTSLRAHFVESAEQQATNAAHRPDQGRKCHIECSSDDLGALKLLVSAVDRTRLSPLALRAVRERLAADRADNVEKPHHSRARDPAFSENMGLCGNYALMILVGVEIDCKALHFEQDGFWDALFKLDAVMAVVMPGNLTKDFEPIEFEPDFAARPDFVLTADARAAQREVFQHAIEIPFGQRKLGRKG